MRIAFDVSPLSHQLLGIGNYIRGSLEGLVDVARGRHEVVAFAPTSLRGRERIEAALEGVDVELRTWQLPFSHALRTGWSTLGHPAAERLLGPFDVLHYSDWMFPPQRSGVRATTIHDLVPLHHPEWTTARTRSMHTRKYRNAAGTCDVVFVNSDYTGRDVVETLGVPPERVHVARPAVKHAFRRDGPAADLGSPYVLTVATLEPRKNLQTLVEAHRLLGEELLLAVVGAEGWGEQPFLADPRVRRLGFVSDDELARLYRGAAVAVYPSRFEGFGIPVIEAMACGVPVVASSHPSLDEASGTAAVRAEPDDPVAIARAIEQAVSERERLVSAGLEHASSFSWRAVGEIFLRGYEQAREPRRETRANEVLVAVHRRDPGGPRFLVLERSPAKQGYWHLAGGGVEPGETIAEAARRELAEETRLEASVDDLGGGLGYDGVDVHAFAAEAPPGWEPTLDEEHDDHRWCTLGEALELLAYEEPREVLRRAASRLGAAG